jgi:hypothetical protein
MGSGVLAPFIVNLVLGWGEWSADPPTTLPPVSSRRLGRPQSYSGCFEEEISVLLLPGFESRFLRGPARSFVTNSYAIKAAQYILSIFFRTGGFRSISFTFGTFLCELAYVYFE